MWALAELWRDPGFDDLEHDFGRSRHEIDVDQRGELFSYTIRETTPTPLEMLDGTLLMATNAPAPLAGEFVARHMNLADIERGFHVLKSDIDIEIGPAQLALFSTPGVAGPTA